MKKFCESLREHTIKIINFEKKKMVPSTNGQQELHERQKSATFAKKSSYINRLMIKIIKYLNTIIII